MSSWQTAFRHLTLFHCFWRQRGCSLGLLAMAIQCQAVRAQRRPTVHRRGEGEFQGRTSLCVARRDTTE